MSWRLEGITQSVMMEFVVDGQPVIPDANSIHFTAWDHAGVQIESYAFVPVVGDAPTQMKVVMSGALNSIAVDALFETRYLRADFMHNAKPYWVSTSYHLHRMVPMTITPQVVRALVGADTSELPDVDIDLMGAYVLLMGLIPTTLPLALRRTDSVALAANRAIALQTAVTLCPSLQSRLLKSEKADNAGFQRVDMDFLKLERDLRAQLANSLIEVSAGSGEVVIDFVSHTIFAVTKQTDRITNSDA